MGIVLGTLLAVAVLCGLWFTHRREKGRAGFESGIGNRVPELTFRATDGGPVSLRAFQGDRLVAVVFMGTQCPVGNQYLPRMMELQRRFADRGVAFLGVNANDSESAEQVAQHAREYGLTFPVVKDPENAAADALRIGRTCETLLIDRSGILRYRGAIDDEFRPGQQKGQGVHHYLADAVEAVLAGRSPEPATTPVLGCPIERAVPVRGAAVTPRVRAAHPAIVASRRTVEESVEVKAVDYARDVAPILQEKCQVCHRPRQVAPCSLLTYRDAKRWATGIAEVVEDYRMPPWHADPRYGEFANDRSLTDRERAVLLAWVEQGAPAGDLEKAPPPRSFPEGWSIGEPDLVIDMNEPYIVPASGTVEIQRFRVATGFTTDRWVQQAEMRPGDRAVVHHMFIYIEPHDPNRDNTHRTGPVLVAYAPGDAPSIYPPGIAKRIPAGADLLFEVHYSPIGKERVDRSSVGMIFAREPVRHEAVFAGIADKALVIPPHAANYRSQSSHVFPKASHLLSVFPHMHLRGKDFECAAYYPDGKREVLLSVPAYDFAWQSVYRFAEPKALPAGTRVVCTAHFDNSTGNPANPDPNQTVRWGSQTTDEMMTGFIDYYEDAARLTR